MAKESTWTVVLGISQLSVLQLLDKANKTYNKIKGPMPQPPGVPNKYFVAPNPEAANPSLAEFKAFIEALETAKDAIIGGKPKTLAIAKAKKDLKAAFKLLGNYIEIVANLPANFEIGDQIIESAGLNWLITGGSSKAEDLTVKYDEDTNAKVHARDKRLAKGTTYDWLFKAKTETDWTSARKGNPAKYTYTGLTIGISYQFQVEHTLPDGTITMSAIMELPKQ